MSGRGWKQVELSRLALDEEARFRVERRAACKEGKGEGARALG